jgi:hypothetical protein
MPATVMQQQHRQHLLTVRRTGNKQDDEESGQATKQKQEAETTKVHGSKNSNRGTADKNKDVWS